MSYFVLYKKNRLRISWHGWACSEFVWKGARFNGGGYAYGASPYRYWKIGPIMIMRYM